MRMPAKVVLGVLVLSGMGVACADEESDRLIGAMLGETPAIADLKFLTDHIGGRVTGTDANAVAVAWALHTFGQAGVDARVETFEMPSQWQEISVSAIVSGDIEFVAGVVAKPFSAAADNNTGPLIDAGMGSATEIAALGDKATGAWMLVETPLLDDEIGLNGLFAEYGAAATTERLIYNSGAAGIVFMSSRPNNLLYRLPLLSAKNRQPVLLMEREDAKRIQRLLRSDQTLSLSVSIDLDSGYAYESANVIGEIRGSSRPEEIVLIGAHLDSHDLGTGALDNGSNVVMLIDIARQITKLGLTPERTIRFALWNGEEQGLVGSWRYAQQHQDELDDHIMATSFDIGTGRILGFFTGGRAGLGAMVDGYLEPVAGLGPFSQVNIPLVGTDNFDFMIEGIPNLIALQADANYASNYHASSDTFDKVDQQQLKLNSAIAAAMVWGFANSRERLPRHSRRQIEELIGTTDLEQQMRNFGVWEDWSNGVRGRQK